MTETRELTMFGPEAGPAPRDRPLVVQIPCGDLAGDLSGGEHPITIRPDWSVNLGHDLYPERIAAALGGSPSCLHVVERVIPALRVAVQVQRRRGLPVVRNHRRLSGWSLATCNACGEGGGAPLFNALGDAVAHGRETSHLARALDCDRRLLEILLQASAAAYGGFGIPPRGRADRLVCEPDGTQTLWDAGIHPGWAVAAHEHFWPDERPLPAGFYLGLAYLRPSEEYLRNMITAQADPNLATWSIWSGTPEDTRDPAARADLVRAGVDVDQLRDVVDAGYTCAAIRSLSLNSGRGLRAAVTCLAGWVRIGCQPDVSELSWGIGRVLTDDRLIPGNDDLDTLVGSLPEEFAASRTEAGVVLAVAGSVDRAREVLGQGLRGATESFEYLEDTGNLGR